MHSSNRTCLSVFEACRNRFKQSQLPFVVWEDSLPLLLQLFCVLHLLTLHMSLHRLTVELQHQCLSQKDNEWPRNMLLGLINLFETGHNMFETGTNSETGIKLTYSLRSGSTSGWSMLGGSQASSPRAGPTKKQCFSQSCHCFKWNIVLKYASNMLRNVSNTFAKHPLTFTSHCFKFCKQITSSSTSHISPILCIRNNSWNKLCWVLFAFSPFEMIHPCSVNRQESVTSRFKHVSTCLKHMYFRKRVIQHAFCILLHLIGELTLAYGTKQCFHSFSTGQWWSVCCLGSECDSSMLGWDWIRDHVLPWRLEICREQCNPKLVIQTIQATAMSLHSTHSNMFPTSYNHT